MSIHDLNTSDSAAGKLPHIEALTTSAEAAIDTLDVDMKAWLEDDLTQLEEAWTAAVKARFDAETTRRLYRAAHNLAGMSGTYGYPEIGKFAARLCEQLGVATARLDTAQTDACIKACRAASGSVKL